MGGVKNSKIPQRSLRFNRLKYVKCWYRIPLCVYSIPFRVGHCCYMGNYGNPTNNQSSYFQWGKSSFMFGHGDNINSLIYLLEIFLIYLPTIDLTSACAEWRACLHNFTIKHHLVTIRTAIRPFPRLTITKRKCFYILPSKMKRCFFVICLWTCLTVLIN